MEMADIQGGFVINVDYAVNVPEKSRKKVQQWTLRYLSFILENIIFKK